MSANRQIHPVSKDDYAELIEVWEASVRATHDFLPESDIEYFKPLILNEYFDAVTLFCCRNEDDSISGFGGVADKKIEMLFVKPADFGKGVGRTLLNHAVEKFDARELDVNEQNEQAVGFYKHLGFEVIGRSPVDGLGKPYPLLHLKLP